MQARKRVNVQACASGIIGQGSGSRTFFSVEPLRIPDFAVEPLAEPKLPVEPLAEPRLPVELLAEPKLPVEPIFFLAVLIIRNSQG